MMLSGWTYFKIAQVFLGNLKAHDFSVTISDSQLSSGNNHPMRSACKTVITKM